MCVGKSVCASVQEVLKMCADSRPTVADRPKDFLISILSLDGPPVYMSSGLTHMVS